MGGNDPGSFALQVTLHAYSLVGISKTRSKDTVDKTLEDGGHTAPPNWEDPNKMVRPGNELAVFFHFRILVQIAAKMFFIKAQERIKFFCIEVQDSNLVFGIQMILHLLKNSTIKTLVVGMSVDD